MGAHRQRAFFKISDNVQGRPSLICRGLLFSYGLEKGERKGSDEK